MKIQRPALWLFRALGIVRGVNPSTLLQDVSPVLDIGQGGWGQGEFEQFITSRTTNGVNNICSTDGLTQALVWVSLINTGAAATTSWWLLLRARDVGTGSSMYVYYESPIPAATLRGHAQLLGSMVPVIVPPNSLLQIQSGDLTASGNTHETRALIQRMPAGYKPW